MAIQFKDNPQLGQVVQDVKVFCKLMATMPIPTYEYVVGDFNNPQMHALAGHKWSRLCGFTFKSNKNVEHPKFQFVYVPKLRSSIVHTNRGLHGWYCWMYIDVDDKKVLSIDDMQRIYGFNINDFVHSDMFEHWVPIFIKNVSYALHNQMHKLIESTIDLAKRRELERYALAIRKSLLEIWKVQEIVYDDEFKDTALNTQDTYAANSEPKAGHVKLAYNADKTYPLKNLDKQNDNENK